MCVSDYLAHFRLRSPPITNKDTSHQETFRWPRSNNTCSLVISSQRCGFFADTHNGTHFCILRRVCVPFDRHLPCFGTHFACNLPPPFGRSLWKVKLRVSDIAKNTQLQHPEESDRAIRRGVWRPLGTAPHRKPFNLRLQTETDTHIIMKNK